MYVNSKWVIQYVIANADFLGHHLLFYLGYNFPDKMVEVATVQHNPLPKRSMKFKNFRQVQNYKKKKKV